MLTHSLMATAFFEMKKPIHFFKIIVTQSLHQGKLMIPRKFVKKYGDCLPKAICLKTPNGEDWKMSLAKNDGRIWFDKGWKEFADYHFLSHGHLLVFKYEKTSHFEVRIFDKSALEINYLKKRVKEEDCMASKKRKANSSFEIGSSSSVKVAKSQKVVAVHHTHKKRIGKQVNRTLERAKSFKTCNPSFLVFMGASYVGHRFVLSIPSMFGKIHFDLDKKEGYLYFKVSNSERVWPARYSMRMINAGQRFELTSGWKKFSMDNNLKVGDVCNFELILRTNMTFQVHIFRQTDKDNTNCSTSQKSSQTLMMKLLKDREGVKTLDLNTSVDTCVDKG